MRLLVIRGAHSLDVLSAFVAWSRLPSSATSTPLQCQVDLLGCISPSDGVRFDVQPTSSANRGWLDTLMHNQLPINFLVREGGDLGNLIPALRRYSQPLVLTLLGSVEPVVLGEVLAAYSGHELTLSIIPPPATAPDTDTEDDADGEEAAVEHNATPTGRPELTDQHLQAMLPHVAKLSSLDVRNCEALSARAVREVVEGGGDGLTKLCLSGAKKVSNWTMSAVLRSCRNLQRLELTGARRVTEAGLAPLGWSFCSPASLPSSLARGSTGRICRTRWRGREGAAVLRRWKLNLVLTVTTSV
jgi:hypothetical protein